MVMFCKLLRQKINMHNMNKQREPCVGRGPARIFRGYRTNSGTAIWPDAGQTDELLLVTVTRSFPLVFRTSASPISLPIFLQAHWATGQKICAIRYNTLALTLTLEMSELFRICTYSYTNAVECEFSTKFADKALLMCTVVYKNVSSFIFFENIVLVCACAGL